MNEGQGGIEREEGKVRATQVSAVWRKE
jgi:hypothetical protein